MPDNLDAAIRSKIMASIRGTNTRPEIAVRKRLFAKGYRYRLHDKRLAGRPDIILPKYRAAVFVNGCFWHGHNCDLYKLPTTNREYWRTKIINNKERDQKAIERLRGDGWRVLIIWECSLKKGAKISIDNIIGKMDTWIKSNQKYLEIRERQRLRCSKD